jgi:hypothetical protein
MHTPTDEQNAILCFLQHEGTSAIVTAVPGAGKTTLALQAAQQNTCGGTLILSYNRALRDSTHAAIADHNLSDTVHAFTYHSLLTSLCEDNIPDDLALHMALRAGRTSRSSSSAHTHWPQRDFGLLVIDEAQDLRPDYFRLLRLLVRTVCLRPEHLHVLVLGDPHQLLYGFYAESKADVRFFTWMNNLQLHPLSSPALVPSQEKQTSPHQATVPRWVRRALTRSYRLTESMVRFVNTLYPGVQIQAKPTSSASRPPRPVDVYLCDVYKDSAHIVLGVLRHSGLPPSEVLVVLPSLNQCSPAVAIVDRLVACGYRVHVSRSGMLSTGSASPLDTLGKIRFKTFCGCKGLEARLVVYIDTQPVLGRGADVQAAQYVALTRASEHLVVLTDTKHSDAESLARLQRTCGSHVHVHHHHHHEQRGRVRRFPPPPPPPRPNAVFIPVNLPVEGLYAFMDVTRMPGMLQTFTTTSVLPPVVTSSSASLVATDETTSLAAQVGKALLLAVEYRRRRQLPGILVTTLHALRASVHTNTKSVAMLDCATAALNTVLLALRRPTTTAAAARNPLTDVSLEHFVTLAIVMDAWSNYSEHLHYSCATRPPTRELPVFLERLEAALTLVENLHSDTDTDTDKPSPPSSRPTPAPAQHTWHRQHTATVLFQEQPRHVTATPVLMCTDTLHRAVCVTVVHTDHITDTQRLVALATTAVATHGSGAARAVVVNSKTGAVEQLTLCAGLTSTQYLQVSLNAKYARDRPLTDAAFLKQYENE